MPPLFPDHDNSRSINTYQCQHNGKLKYKAGSDTSVHDEELKMIQNRHIILFLDY